MFYDQGVPLANLPSMSKFARLFADPNSPAIKYLKINPHLGERKFKDINDFFFIDNHKMLPTQWTTAGERRIEFFNFTETKATKGFTIVPPDCCDVRESIRIVVLWPITKCQIRLLIQDLEDSLAVFPLPGQSRPPEIQMQEAIPDCDHIQISKYEWNGDIIPDVYRRSLHCLVQWLHRSSPDDRELSEDETKRLAQVIDEKCQDFAMEVKRKLHRLGRLSL